MHAPITPHIASQMLLSLLLLAALPSQAAPDLAVSMTVDNAQPAPGEPVAFTIELSNVGADSALDARVEDVLPPGTAIPDGAAAFPSVGSYDPATGTWAVGGLDPAQSVTLVVPAIITDPQPPACIVNTATAFDAEDRNVSNDVASAALRQPGVERCVDVAATFLSAGFMPSGCLEKQHWIQVTLRNAGPDAARNVTVGLSQAPVIRSDLEFADAQCSSIVDGQCLIDELPPGAELRLAALSTPFLPDATRTQELTLSVSSDDVDYLPDNDGDSRTITVAPGDICPDIDIGNIGVGPACFIATAAYGSILDPHVDALRRFRDKYLLTHSWGRKFVSFYYRHSPPMAHYIAQRPWARASARALLTPLVLAVAYPVSALVLALGLVLAWLAGSAVRQRRLLCSARG